GGPGARGHLAEAHGARSRGAVPVGRGGPARARRAMMHGVCGTRDASRPRAGCWPAVAACVALTGCSLVYDADDLRGRDGGAPDAAIGGDELYIARTVPAAVLEGEGSGLAEEDGERVRPVPIVLEGQNMSDDTVFEIALPGAEPVPLEVVVSGDGSLAAFALRVPISEELDPSQGGQIQIHYSDGEVSRSRLITVEGLGALVRDGGTIDTDQLAPRYSHVVLSGEVSALGAAPLRLVATAGISIDGVLSADADRKTAGPGGCPGGEPAADAMCGAGSG